jgi:hypothetical protein
MDSPNNNNLVFVDFGCPIPTPAEPQNGGTVELLQAQADWIALVGIPAPLAPTEDANEE